MAEHPKFSWIARGQWHVNLAEGLAAHGPDGCVFRIVREPLSAICIEARGAPPPVEQLAVLQARATGVFWTTERLIETLNRRSIARGSNQPRGGRPSG
jgi:hypothetical protein